MAWQEQQLPTGESVFLDHLGFFVDDIDAAGPRLERLGFTLQPVSIHYNESTTGELTRSGTANRLVTFGLGYLEVLASVAKTPLSEQLESSLARYEGLHLIALAHGNVASREARFAVARVAMQPTVELRRNLETAEGPAQVRATVARCMPGVMEEGRAQMLTHNTPEFIWLPGYDQHLNGVDALQEMLVVSADPTDAGTRYQRFSGCAAETVSGLCRVMLDRGWLTFTSEERARLILPELDCPASPYCAALVLRSPDLDRTRAALAANGVVPLIDTRELLCVAPEDGLGAYFIFQPHSDPTVWERLSEIAAHRGA